MVHVDNQNTDDHVKDLWIHRGENEYDKVVVAVKESTYKKKPLGRSYNRGHRLPEYMYDSEYRHGVQTSKPESNAKRLIYPLETNLTDAISKGLHQPGQQKKRNYNWPVNPTSTVFGVKGEIETSRGRGSSFGVASALKMDDDTISAEDRNKPVIDYDKVFGKSTRQGNDSAAECLGHIGDNTIDEDSYIADDLGKSLTPGFRNAETKHRTFGCPSIRTDIPKYKRSSVADVQNYGDDTSSAYLLRPSVLSSLGLEEDEFEISRTKEYLQRLVITCGILKDDDSFESIFRRVADESNCASIEDFLRECCCDDGEKPKTGETVE